LYAFRISPFDIVEGEPVHRSFKQRLFFFIGDKTSILSSHGVDDLRWFIFVTDWAWFLYGLLCFTAVIPLELTFVTVGAGKIIHGTC